MAQQLKLVSRQSIRATAPFDPNTLPGLTQLQGGEARVFLNFPIGIVRQVFDTREPQVLKVFKTPDDPSYSGDKESQERAAARLAEHQNKLPAMPAGHDRMITPTALGLSVADNSIAAYTMRYLNRSSTLFELIDPEHREKWMTRSKERQLLIDLHGVITKTHTLNFRIGDLNWLNILVVETITNGKPGYQCFLIDTDSMSWGKWHSSLYTPMLVDPVFCDLKDGVPVLVKPRDELADWYAYTLMALKVLTGCGAWEGIYRPKSRTELVKRTERPFHRISVLHPQVGYPDTAIPLEFFPPELMHHIYRVIHKGERIPFPVELLEMLEWKTCNKCGAEHARGKCPVCHPTTATSLQEELEVYAASLLNAEIVDCIVNIQPIHVSGKIVHAQLEHTGLKWVTFHDGVYTRENGTVVARSSLNPWLKFAISKMVTYIASDGYMSVVGLPQRQGQTIPVSMYQHEPAFGANEEAGFWMTPEGFIKQSATFGATDTGKAIPGNTRLWIGKTFGYGFYLAGKMVTGFIIDPNQPKLNTAAFKPPLRGAMIKAECVFTSKLCYLLIATEEHGVIFHRCYVIDQAGRLLAHDEAQQGDDEHWLGTTISGLTATGSMIFVPDVHKGIVRVDLIQGGQGHSLRPVEEFPATAKYLTASSKLFFSSQGIFVVNIDSITLLQIIRK